MPSFRKLESQNAQGFGHYRHTRLVFLYRPWREDGARVPDGEAEIAMKDKVVKLLSAYGSTLANEDHGRNLIHKLLLEGHLIVQNLVL